MSQYHVQASLPCHELAITKRKVREKIHSNTFLGPQNLHALAISIPRHQLLSPPFFVSC